MSYNSCSFELVRFRTFYGINYRVPDSDCKFFELIGSTGSISYAVSGYIYFSGDKESYVVTGLESNRPKDAFYSSLPELSSVTDVGLVVCGYNPDDPVIVDFCDYLEDKNNEITCVHGV